MCTNYKHINYFIYTMSYKKFVFFKKILHICIFSQIIFYILIEIFDK